MAALDHKCVGPHPDQPVGALTGLFSGARGPGPPANLDDKIVPILHSVSTAAPNVSPSRIRASLSHTISLSLSLSLCLSVRMSCACVHARARAHVGLFGVCFGFYCLLCTRVCEVVELCDCLFVFVCLVAPSLVRCCVYLLVCFLFDVLFVRALFVHYLFVCLLDCSLACLLACSFVFACA